MGITEYLFNFSVFLSTYAVETTKELEYAAHQDDELVPLFLIFQLADLQVGQIWSCKRVGLADFDGLSVIEMGRREVRLLLERRTQSNFKLRERTRPSIPIGSFLARHGIPSAGAICQKLM